MKVRIAGATLATTLLLVGSACGGDSDNAPAGSSTPTTSSAAADTALAEGALMTLADFPDGWESGEVSSGTGSSGFAPAFNECMGLDTSLLSGGDDGAEAVAPGFKSPTDQEVSNSISVALAEERATELFDVLTSPEAPDCVAEALAFVVTKSAAGDEPGEAEIGEVSVEEIEVATAADQTVAFRLTLPVTVEAEDLAIDVFGDLVFLRVGRAACVLTFLDYASPFPSEDTEHYADLVATRLDSALG